MHIKANSLDDLLLQVFKRLLKSRLRTRSTAGEAREIISVLLTLNNPRARFSRTEQRATLFSCLGETLWYLSGSDRIDVIEYYIPSYKKFARLPEDAVADPGAYGPRLFGRTGQRQIDSIIDMLKRKPDTRQAVAQIFAAPDLLPPAFNVPCTCTVQFFARGGVLHVMTHMRSNDAYRGLPHDIFAFTFIQELVARSISHEVGAYHHSIGSLHLYEADQTAARQYITEGWQQLLPMPPMPKEDPWRSIRWLLEEEEKLRRGDRGPLIADGVAPYWVDLARLLRIKAHFMKNDMRAIVKEKNAMTSDVYNEFIRGRETRGRIELQEPQLSFSTIDPTQLAK